jgi:hypothetical protein
VVKLKETRGMNFNEWRKSLGLLLLVAGCSLASISLSSAATKASPEPPQAVAQAPVDFTRLQFSAGLLDIVRMVKANVNPDLIRTFIMHSPVSYHPSAQEVIALKKLGVANEIIVELMGHRSQASENPQLSARQMVRVPAPGRMPALPGPPYDGGGYPVNSYRVHAFPVFGSLTSFNNSYPTYVSGYPVYSGYYLQAYPVLW